MLLCVGAESTPTRYPRGGGGNPRGGSGVVSLPWYLVLATVPTIATLANGSCESSLSHGKVCAYYCASERRRHPQDLPTAARDIELIKRTDPEEEPVWERWGVSFCRGRNEKCEETTFYT